MIRNVDCHGDHTDGVKGGIEDVDQNVCKDAACPVPIVGCSWGTRISSYKCCPKDHWCVAGKTPECNNLA
jgi:hypothetical protein